MKKSVIRILILLFFAYSTNISLVALDLEGQRLLKEGKQFFLNGEFDKAVVSLRKALNYELSGEEKVEAHLYLGMCKIALGSVNDGIDHFKEILILDPEYIIEEDVPPEIKDIFEATKYKFPVIYEFFSLPEMFYPYKDESPYLKFKLSSNDCVSLSITSNNVSISKDKKCFMASDFQSYGWKWTDQLMEANEICFTLIPDKNKSEYSFQKKIILEKEIPKELIFSNNKFSIKGQEFLPEKKIKKSYPNLLLYTAVAALSGVGAYASFSYNPENNNSSSATGHSKTTYVTIGVFATALALFSLIEAFTPKKKSVSIEKNIEKNNKLRKQIEALKEKIKVTQIEEEAVIRIKQ